MKISIITSVWNNKETIKDAIGSVLSQTYKNIEYIEMPDNLKGQYQYRTEADLSKLRKVGYTKFFQSLKDSIADYVLNYLEKPNPYL